MAASVLPSPTKPGGPCPLSADCQHRDCLTTWVMASEICPHCDEPIGFDTPFYDVTEPPGDLENQILVHASCEEAFVPYQKIRGGS